MKGRNAFSTLLSNRMAIMQTWKASDSILSNGMAMMQIQRQNAADGVLPNGMTMMQPQTRNRQGGLLAFHQRTHDIYCGVVRSRFL
jgi:hypothetical protein